MLIKLNFQYRLKNNRKLYKIKCIKIKIYTKYYKLKIVFTGNTWVKQTAYHFEIIHFIQLDTALSIVSFYTRSRRLEEIESSIKFHYSFINNYFSMRCSIVKNVKSKAQTISSLCRSYHQNLSINYQ